MNSNTMILFIIYIRVNCDIGFLEEAKKLKLNLWTNGLNPILRIVNPS